MNSVERTNPEFEKNEFGLLQRLKDLRRAITAKMPRKSTWFTPKARGGLVLAELGAH